MSLYSEDRAAYVMEVGDYVVRVGNSSRNTSVEAVQAALSSAIDGLVANIVTDTPVNPSTPDNTVSPNELVSSSVSNGAVKNWR